jgi:hypothetical protein
MTTTPVTASYPVGHPCTIVKDAFTIACRIEAVKYSYGVERYLVRALSPSNGQAWVNSENVKVSP